MVKPKISKEVKDAYIDILSQCFSPCKNLLVAGNNYGDINVFDLRSALSSPEDADTEHGKSWLSFSIGQNRAVCSLTGSDKFLIAGTIGEVIGYDWKSILAGKVPKVMWSWTLPQKKNELDVAEVNILKVFNGNVYVGSGDSNIYVYSLEDGRSIKTFSGHEGYIHDLCLVDGNQLASCGEDGSIRFWNVETGLMEHIIEPFKESSLARPHLGNWVGALHVDKHWLLCGGGVRPSLWHLPTMQLSSKFDCDDVGIHALMIHEERVLIGGKKRLIEFNLLGEIISSLPCSSNTLLSLVFTDKDQRLLSMAGTSRYLDISTDLETRDQVLTCSTC